MATIRLDALERSIPNRVLRYYANRLTDLRNDPELQYGNDFVKNDLLLVATNIQRILGLIDKDHRSVERYVTEDKNTIESAFECYINDLDR